MNQKGIFIIIVLIIALGAITYFFVSKNSSITTTTPITTNPSPKEKSLILYYSFPYNQAIIKENGEITLTIPKDDIQEFNYQCTVINPQPAAIEGRPPAPSLLETLFGMASSPEFLDAEKEYLPPKDSFAYFGHDTRIMISLKDDLGNTLQSVIFSDRPEKIPPQLITNLGTAIYQYVWEYNKERLEKACGPIPRTIRGID